ncbi:MAG: 1-deoxy-D-xylulose-5-phosphate reductoisomerase [Bacillota bacterium]|nr:1-deoxy-D-xylulose-5-phosphate reductoisomerase [Bacillota bacterium]MDW7676061.1 1-deoxy-D-xylulose-5-phosphate reductoisomerase [Bacillota bacterium]
MKKNVALLGSTGSIGTQTLDIMRMHPERFCVTVLSAGRNIDLLEAQIGEFMPEIAVMERKEDAARLQKRISSHTKVLHGMTGIEYAVTHPETQIVLNALVGSRGLIPTCRALENGKDVALANKESLVAGGELVMASARHHQAHLIPVDSEHSAIFQCLNGEKIQSVKRIILTASGGPFREWSRAALRNVGVKEALNHPNWSMGRKITIDSATMMNKGLEVIEAAWLFGLKPEQIHVLIHPQSIIHSMIEFCDTSVMAQMGLPDMRIPIQYALSWPDRVPNHLPSLMLEQIGTLTFEKPNMDKFPCLRLAMEALKIGKTMPCVLNAANDILVEAFLNEQIAFYEIPELIESIMLQHNASEYSELEELMEVEAWVKSTLRSFN